MLLTPPAPSAPRPTGSVFVHGPDESAVPVLVVGLALRVPGSFSWADCAVVGADATPETARLFARGLPHPLDGEADRNGLGVPTWTSAALHRLLVPESRMDGLHLIRCLTLPELPPEITGRSTGPTGQSTILLANVDALDPALRATLLERAELHGRLHREGVTLLVTCRTQPTPREEKVFDHIVRVDVPPGADWSEGSVCIEKGLGSGPGDLPRPIRTVWNAMGLDPTLLPPL
jgi:hypothetical protein